MLTSPLKAASVRYQLYLKLHFKFANPRLHIYGFVSPCSLAKRMANGPLVVE